MAAAHPLAVGAGTDVLAAGGNALDAAVATAAALAVVTPDACGLGGDALLLVQAAGEPAVAYVGAAAIPARPIRPVTVYGAGSAGVPGAVAAWCEAHARFGRLPLSAILEPGIELAGRGFPASAGLTGALNRRRERLQAAASGWAVLGAVTGATLRQPELARTLEEVGSGGPEAFYTRRLAHAIIRAAATPDGRGIAEDDLAGYAVTDESPVTGVYGRARLSVVPPPSQAALALLALQALEGAPPPGTPQGEHAAIEAIKEVFDLRDAVTAGADLDLLWGRRPLPPGDRASALRGPTAGDHTAAVTAADADGLVVSMLVSVFHEFGSGVLVPEGGFVLNNRLSGLVRSRADSAELPPGARPGHTLAPLIFELDGRRVALATPGADGQVQTLVQIIRRLNDAGAGLTEALHAPRWRAVEGRVAVEASLAGEVVEGLRARGHELDHLPDGHPLFGSAAAAGLGGQGGVICASDPRREVWGAVR